MSLRTQNAMYIFKWSKVSPQATMLDHRVHHTKAFQEQWHQNLKNGPSGTSKLLKFNIRWNPSNFSGPKKSMRVESTVLSLWWISSTPLAHSNWDGISSSYDTKLLVRGGWDGKALATLECGLFQWCLELTNSVDGAPSWGQFRQCPTSAA